MNESEDGVDLALMKTSMPFSCKSCCNANELQFALETQVCEVCFKAKSSLAFIQRPGN